MKHSMHKIFKNLNLFLIVILMVAGVAMLLLVEKNTSYIKIKNLNLQKETIASLANLQKKDIELALIQFNGKSTQLHHEIDKLYNLYKYNITGRYVLSNSDEYMSDLNKLRQLTVVFNEKAHAYYTEKNKEDKNLKNAFYSIHSHINSMIFKNIAYDEAIFSLLEKISIITFVFIFIITFWYRRRLNFLYQDILFLYAVDKNKKDYAIFSEEVDAIALRMNRKAVTSDNPTMLDPVTGINNHKGMINSYTDKKGMKDSNFISVTIFEIDNFSKANRVFSQEFTQAVLKKIAFTISLHEQPTDVIARTDYNQFTLIFSRPSKEQSFKDVDIIRESISEIKFKTNNGEEVKITLSGGFIIKSNNQTLEDALKQAKETLQHAKSRSKNTISQLRDLAKHAL
ncbi:diguanylate cyclase [bacterium]|nr:diguanylate cyclase [bacterium]MBU1994324.1 diguanylate cyclase [bacterium]